MLRYAAIAAASCLFASTAFADAVLDADTGLLPQRTGETRFAERSWTFQTNAAAAIGDKKGDQFDLHTGVGYFFADGWSFNVEVLGGTVDPRDDDKGVVGGFDLLLRWHFLRDQQAGRWSLYLASGAGFQQASTNFPSDSHHNFRLNFLDLGGTLNVHDNIDLMAGVRYLHVSNAGTSEHNDGLDAAMPYAGLMIGF